MERDWGRWRCYWNKLPRSDMMPKSNPKFRSEEFFELHRERNSNAFNKWSEREDELLEKRVNAGWTIRRISEASGRSRRAVELRIERNELAPTRKRRVETRRSRRTEKMTTEAMEEMNRRMDSGEFGSPPDMALVNNAWQEILELKLQEAGKNGNFNSITGLWPRSGEKVAFDGRVKEEITIPAGSKILCFYGNPEPGTRQPELNLVYVTYDD